MITWNEAATECERRDALELLVDQLAGIDSWVAAERHEDVHSVATARAPREMLLDLRRRMEARRREQAAVLTSAAQQLEASLRLLHKPSRPTAALVHRNAWLRAKLTERLTQRGVTVLAASEDGTQAVGVLVVEQPDLLLVEDRLPGLSGLEVLRRAARHAPKTVVGVQVLDLVDGRTFMDEGASAVYTRQVPPRGLADDLLEQLAKRRLASSGT